MATVDSGPYEWASALADTVKSRTGVDLHAHVLARLAALLSRDAIAYVDADLDATDQSERTSGRLLVWTDRHLAIVDLRELLLPGAGSGMDESGEVAVVVLPRSSLRRIEMPADPEVNRGWMTGLRPGALRWPRSRLRLRFEGLDEDLEIPIGTIDPAFGQLVLDLVREQAQ